MKQHEADKLVIKELLKTIQHLTHIYLSSIGYKGKYIVIGLSKKTHTFNIINNRSQRSIKDNEHPYNSILETLIQSLYKILDPIPPHQLVGYSVIINLHRLQETLKIQSITYWGDYDRNQMHQIMIEINDENSILNILGG